MKFVPFSEFAKFASSYETYDYKGSSIRNYIPPKANIKVVPGSGSGSDDSKVVKITPRHNPDMPKNCANKAEYNDDATWGVDHSHARGTVSGTGFGKRYWQEPRNGYGI